MTLVHKCRPYLLAIPEIKEGCIIHDSLGKYRICEKIDTDAYKYNKKNFGIESWKFFGMMFVSLENRTIVPGDIITDGKRMFKAHNIDGFIGFREVMAIQSQIPTDSILKSINSLNNDEYDDHDVLIEMEESKIAETFGYDGSNDGELKW